MLSRLKITLHWWQAAVYEIAVLALGVIIGSYLGDLFRPYLLPLGLIALIAGGYILRLWLNQNRETVLTSTERKR